MTNEVQGVISRIYENDVTIKRGPKAGQAIKAYNFIIDGDKYSGGFKKWGAGEGDEVVITFDQTPQGYRNITGLSKVASAPKSDSDSGAGGTSYGKNTFPMAPDAPQRSINRQNALTNAVKYHEGSAVPVEIILNTAREFEAYTTGDTDYMEALAAVEAEGS